MAVEQWHYGKMILIWVAVGGFAFIWHTEAEGYYIVPLIVTVIAFGITWKWISGKEK